MRFFIFMIRRDITGQKFGLLTVIKFAFGGKNSNWLCRCECGRERTLPMPNLKSGNTTTCGECVSFESPNFIDRVGHRYGRLTVLGNVSKAKNRQTRTNWYCLCDCGEYTTVESGNLSSGHTQSCGCFLLDQITTHGCCTENIRLYCIWTGMMARCYNPTHKSYRWYGAKNRQVCIEWHNVRTFFTWALDNWYADNLTLERLSSYGNYEPVNCEWIPLRFQNQNTTVSLGKEKVIEMRKLLNKGFTPKEMAAKFNVAYPTVISIKNYVNYKEFRD